MSEQTYSILCMKWGNAYGANYVNLLARAAKKFCGLPYQFICLTDDPSGLDADVKALPIPEMGLPEARIRNGGWPKLSVFKPSLHGLTGRALFIDLDVVLVGSIDDLFLHSGALNIIREWPQWGHRLVGKTDLGGNSAVFSFDLGKQTQIYDRFLADPDAAWNGFRNEQRFLSHHAEGMAFWPDAWCLSFKRHFMRFPLPPKSSPPASARIITFHGRPKPDELAHGGWWGKGVRSGFGAVPFVRDYWQTYEMGQ